MLSRCFLYNRILLFEIFRKIILRIFDHFVKELSCGLDIKSYKRILGECLEGKLEITLFCSACDGKLLVNGAGNKVVNSLGNVACYYGHYRIIAEGCVSLNYGTKRKIRYLSYVRQVDVSNDAAKTEERTYKICSLFAGLFDSYLFLAVS